MQQAFQGASTFKKAMPLMASALAALVIGGVVGVAFIASMNGVDPGPLSRLSSLYGGHWFLMILGFTNALISAELLTLLSMEWSRRTAPPQFIAGFLALYWASILLYLSGHATLGLVAAMLGLGVVGLYTYRTLLARSWIGLPPTHYNYLLTTTPILLIILIAYWLAAGRLGLPSYDLAMATLILPVSAIIAVETRDIPLLLGIPPSRSIAVRSRGLRARATAAYIVSAIGILLVAAGQYLLGGLLTAVGGVLAASSVALLQAIEKGSRAIPSRIKRHVGAHTVISYLWLIGAGVVATIHGLGVDLFANDMYTHMLTLGFMFNVIMGIDAILLYGHAGIGLDKTPPPQPWPGLLLNIGLILRIQNGVDNSYVPVIGGILTGAAIILFYARNMRNIRRILREASQARG